LAIPIQGIADGLTNIFTVIKNIGYALNPFHETFFLKIALIPAEGFEQNIWTESKTALELKMPLIFQISEFMNTIGEVSTGNTKPEFTVTFNNKYGHGTYEIIDFSYFDDYRVFIINFIRMVTWFFFLKRLHKQIPSIIY
jgi:hypothetical protein